MKKHIIAFWIVLSLSLTGCSVKDSTDNSTTTETIDTTSESIEIGSEESVVTSETIEIVTEESVATSEPVKSNFFGVSETAIEIPSGFDYIRVNNGAWAGQFIWKFDDSITRGSVGLKNLAKGSITVIDWEAYYGLTAYTVENSINVTAYNHSKDHPVSESYIMDAANNKIAIDITYDKYTNIDCNNFTNGLYCVTTVFDTMDIQLYFYVNEGKVYCVRVAPKEYYIDRYSRVNEYVASNGETPENNLRNDNIYYPCKEHKDHRCDTGRWIQLSHELLDEHPTWSDEMKVWCLTEWMVKNIAYDDWRVKNGSSRAMTYHVWDGSYSMWDMHIGVCCDFSNVMAIMLREYNIPCIVINNNKHTWNLVYLDGMWNELDITTILPYHCDNFEGIDWTNKGACFNNYMMGRNTSMLLTDEVLNTDLYDDNFWR